MQLIEKKNGHIGTRKIRNVCANCNNGWMSKLEETAKPVLSSLILGENTSLSLKDLEHISLWSVMTFIMAEFTDMSTLAIPNSHKVTLKQELKIEEGWQIWIGTYKGTEWNFRYSHAASQIFPSAEEKMRMLNNKIKVTPNVQTSLFVIGELLIHAVSNPPKYSYLFDIESEFKPYLTKIWPNKKGLFGLRKKKLIKWPSQNILTDDVIDKIRTRLMYIQ